MRHFPFLSGKERAKLFRLPPQSFGPDDPPARLAVALGATLYSPGDRRDLAEDAHRAARVGATSHVWCLEDSVAHAAVPAAEQNVVRHLGALAATDRVPLLFVRARTPEQVDRLAAAAGASLGRLTGVVIPKVRPGEEGERWFDALDKASAHAGRRVLALPVLEHPDLAWTETRAAHLAGLRALFDAHREQVLGLRVGGTDLSGLFGLRRDRQTTIWDVAVVRAMLADVLNVFNRRGDYPVSGPVWEHFPGAARLFKPQLRTTPFESGPKRALRDKLLADDADELLREVQLDRANGFLGKTVIHPTHVGLVNALHVVNPEEHEDALAVAASADRGGALRSAAGNKMNEAGPHALWAEQVLARAEVFGVLADPERLVRLLQRSRAAVEAEYATTPGDPAARTLTL